MVSRGWGRIVHFSSNGVKLGTGRAPYIAAKHAVEGYVQIMAREFGKQGVIFSVVRPGPIYTPGLFIYEQDEAWTKAFMEKYVPMGRWGKDDEVAAAVALLCSDRAGYMAGAVVDVDGGMR
jgi:NAD(P)-dependent dehydrogenase (short-subunit alcohol dehydrogenase family)